MNIEKVMAIAGYGGYYFDDARAIRSGAEQDNFIYLGKPLTYGFRSVRQPSEVVSIMMVLSDGVVVYGDCIANQYAGAGNRGAVFSAEETINYVESNLSPWLEGYEITNFRNMAHLVDNYAIDQMRANSEVRYGITQALMCAVAHKKNSTITEVISEEYGLPLPTEPVPIFAQSGDNRFENVDKMILRKIECIPHGLINSPGKVGKEGEVMTDYVKWVVDRVQKIGGNDYEPVYHFDVYGILGLIFNGNVDRVADYLAGLSMLTDPNVLRIEYPMLAESKEEAIDLNSSLREKLKKKGVRVRISVDEWCNSVTDMKDFIDADAADLFQVKTPPMGGLNNSIEAVLTCKTYNLGVYLGGSCTETEHAAKVCAQIALSIRPDQVLAKPGMDVDVGHQIIYNEMQRTIKIIEHNQRS